MKDDLQKLKEENEKLQKINELRSDLISTTSHSLYTSLSTLKWTLKMFLDGDLGDLTSEQKEYILKLYETNDRAIDLVSEAIETNKTEDLALVYSKEEVGMVEIIKNVIHEFEGKAYKSKINITFNEPKKKPALAYVDKGKIRIVLQNLIDNAIKYTQSGGEITIKAEKKNDAIEISVTDTGIGISKRDQDKVFEKFMRTEKAKNKEAFGTGLGLYIAKSFVEGQNGKIWFESEENKGSTFHFTIPIA